MASSFVPAYSRVASPPNSQDLAMDIDTPASLPSNFRHGLNLSTRSRSRTPLDPISRFEHLSVTPGHTNRPPEVRHGVAAEQIRMEDDDDMEELYWNPPPDYPFTTVNPADVFQAPAQPVASTSTSASSYASSTATIRALPALHQSQAATDTPNRDIVGPNQPLTTWVLARHSEEGNPWSPFLGIKCSHRTRRKARSKAHAAKWEKRQKALLNFSLAEWVRSRRTI